MDQITSVLKKYNHFHFATFKTIDSISQTEIHATFTIQNDDEIDTHAIKFEFRGVNDFRIVQNMVLSLLDMSGGISIIKYDHIYGFTLGRSNDDLLAIKNAPLYIVASNITITEEELI